MLQSHAFGTLRYVVFWYYCFSSLRTMVLLHTGYRIQPTTHVNGSSHDKQTHQQISLAWCRLAAVFFTSAMPCHVMPCPGGLRDLTDKSTSDAHINMTYVPYLHPAAVGPFCFAGYCIYMLHVACCMAWHGSVGMW